MSEEKRREIGEGDRESARRYNKHTREFVDSESRKGRSPRPETLDEEVQMDELTEAEQAALDRAKEQDPQVSRDYKKPTRSSKQ
jgi:hypothetical protein